MTNLVHKFFYYFYYSPLHVHVSSNILLILRTSNFINTASGIATLSKWKSGAPDGHLLRVTIPDAVGINTIWPAEDEQDIARNMYM